MQLAADELPLVLDETNLATVLHCSVRKVQRLKRSGLLPEPLLPGHPRWSRDEILRWLAGGSQGRGRR